MALSLAFSAIPAEAAWVALPDRPLFQPLVADPRETRGALTMDTKGNRLDAAIGKTLPLFRHEGKRGSFEWGLHAAAFPYLKRSGMKFPMQENDWWFGTYVSGGRRVHWRLDYTHVSTHLGDALFQDLSPIVYSRESIRLIAAAHRGSLRAYVGPGVLVHSIPRERAFFFQTGLEWTSRAIGRDGHLYAAWDMKHKREGEGTFNHALQGGWQFGDAAKGRSVRFGVVYFHGRSENGQFYLAKEDRLSFGVFFDP